eukprot:15048809-Alexandrium_andersonii.AAC.1
MCIRDSSKPARRNVLVLHVAPMDVGDPVVSALHGRVAALHSAPPVSTAELKGQFVVGVAAAST